MLFKADIRGVLEMRSSEMGVYADSADEAKEKIREALEGKSLEWLWFDEGQDAYCNGPETLMPFDKLQDKVVWTKIAVSEFQPELEGIDLVDLMDCRNRE